MDHIRDIKYPFVLGTCIFLITAWGYQAAGFSVDINDVETYIAWSYDISVHSSYESHMPGYPAIILAGRLLTFGLLPDALLAQVLCYVFWIASVILANEILKMWAPSVKPLALLCFALAPLVGVSYVAFPTSECVARAFVLAALLAALHQRWNLFLPIVAMGLFIHQAYYPVYFILALSCVLSKRMSWFYFVASGVPLVAYYIYVAWSKADPNWFLAGHQKMHLSGATHHFFVFDGILQSYSQMNLVAVSKGILLTIVTAIASGLLVFSVKEKHSFSTALVAPVVIFSVIASTNVVFIVIRLSPLLVFPLSYLVERTPRFAHLVQSRGLRMGTAVCLTASQFVWAVYMLRFNSA
jgi:hypothetical protein